MFEKLYHDYYNDHSLFDIINEYTANEVYDGDFNVKNNLLQAISIGIRRTPSQKNDETILRFEYVANNFLHINFHSLCNYISCHQLHTKRIEGYTLLQWLIIRDSTVDQQSIEFQGRIQSLVSEYIKKDTFFLNQRCDNRNDFGKNAIIFSIKKPMLFGMLYGYKKLACDSLSQANYSSVLHDGVVTLSYSTVQTIIQKNKLANPAFDIDKRDSQDDTALQKAINIVAKFNKKSIENHMDIIALLIKENANINARDKNDRTALFFPSNLCPNKKFVINLVTKYGASLNVYDSNEWDPLASAIISASCKQKSRKLTKWLNIYETCNVAYNVNRQFKDGNTLLHIMVLDKAQKKVTFEFIEKLVNAGAQSDIKNDEGKTAFDIADKKTRNLFQAHQPVKRKSGVDLAGFFSVKKTKREGLEDENQRPGLNGGNKG